MTFFAAQLCGDGWSNVGEVCLQINSSRESFDNAQHYCKNLEGKIASLTTAKQVDFVLEELQKHQQKGKVCVFTYVNYWFSIVILNLKEWFKNYALIKMSNLIF